MERTRDQNLPHHLHRRRVRSSHVWYGVRPITVPSPKSLLQLAHLGQTISSRPPLSYVSRAVEPAAGETFPTHPNLTPPFVTHPFLTYAFFTHPSLLGLLPLHLVVLFPIRYW